MPEDKLKISTKKYGGRTSVISTRLPKELIEKLDKVCEKTGRNRNEIVQLCLEYSVENIEIE